MNRVTGILIFILSLTSLNLSAQFFAKGADVSWLTEMEASGKKFYNDQGVQQDALQILKDHCINSIRIRVWVNPANGWSGKEDVIKLAKRVNAMGFKIMIDFHYSDNWADPGKQTVPAAWAGYNVTQLSQAVASHTTDILSALKKEGITPQWVQIGNETSDGMLWDFGRASVNMANYAKFVTSGHNAAKAVFPDIKTIVHVANGFDNSLFRWNIGGLVSNGAQFDVIAMSLYPEPDNWQTLVQQCYSNMTDMVSRYKKPVVISEIGMTYSAPAEAKAFVETIINRNKSLPDKMGLGVFWWEPQAYSWKGYDKVAWGTNGRPTAALDGFLTDCQVVQTDCHGTPGGTAFTDSCGKCAGGNTGRQACKPVKVTFRVNMDGQNTSSGVFITGTMVNWQIVQMKSEGNQVYSYSLSMYPGDTGAYYYLNGNNWNAREKVPAACAEYWDVDRGFLVADSDLLINNNWGSCTDGIVTSLNDRGLTSLNISPNPFNNDLLLTGLNSFRYSISDIQGNMITIAECQTGCKTGEDLHPGVYFLKVESNSETRVYKIIKN